MMAVKHHLAGLYLEKILTDMLVEVGRSEAPLHRALDIVENLPVDIQRDLVCSFLREVRTQVKSTSLREICDQASL